MGRTLQNEESVLTKLTSDLNMEEESLIAQRVVCDGMNSADADAVSLPITKEIRQSCKKACQRKKLAKKVRKVICRSQRKNKRRS